MPDELRPDIPPDAVFATDVPARLDRLPWSRFHWLVIIALGIAWVLDGLEVTIVGSLSGALTESPVLHLTAQQVGLAASAYLIGAVSGALFFGWLTDRLGRKKLFSITVLVYLTATVACGLSWNFWSFAVFRMLTGAGIGGEYAAVNATIQELIPARRRGFTDLVVNGSFWLGAAVGAIGALVVLDPAVMPAEYGWRFAFIIGGVLGLIVLLLRRFLPESPRWLMTHGDPAEAERVVAEIEQRVERETGRPLPPVPHQKLLLRTDIHEWFGPATRALFSDYRRRADTRHRADGGAGVLLQRGVLHLRADPQAVLWDQVGRHRLVHAAVRGGEFPRAAGPRATVRYAWSAADDHLDLRALRHPDGADRLAVRHSACWTRCSRPWPGRRSSSSPRPRQAPPI